MWVRSQGLNDPLKKEMATHSYILAWEIPWTEEPGGLQSMGSPKSQTRLSDQNTTICPPSGPASTKLEARIVACGRPAGAGPHPPCQLLLILQSPAPEPPPSIPGPPQAHISLWPSPGATGKRGLCLAISTRASSGSKTGHF